MALWLIALLLAVIIYQLSGFYPLLCHLARKAGYWDAE
jgi:hypothetical protein